MHHEQSFADMFRDYMKEEASKYGSKFHSFSLDGQDRDAGADYLLTNAHRFTIVEFKYNETSLVSEQYKPKRLTLCKQLSEREDMRKLHDKCHFISWSESNTGVVKTNIYRHEICNKKVFGSDCGLLETVPLRNNMVGADSFSNQFFGPNETASLSLEQFEKYIAWVLKETSASTKSTLELIARSRIKNDLVLVRLDSVAAAQKWVEDNIESSKPKNRRRKKI